MTKAPFSNALRTGQGSLYLATVLDLFSRRLLGYATSTHHDAELTTASLQMGATVRGGQVASSECPSARTTVTFDQPHRPCSEGHSYVTTRQSPAHFRGGSRLRPRDPKTVALRPT